MRCNLDPLNPAPLIAYVAIYLGVFVAIASALLVMVFG